MAIGRTFPESLQKALRGLEQGRSGLNADPGEARYDGLDDRRARCGAAAIGDAATAVPARGGAPARRSASSSVAEATGIDPWFLDQIAEIVDERLGLERPRRRRGDAVATRRGRNGGELKRLGFSDAQIAYLLGVAEAEVRAARLAAGVRADVQDRRHLRRGVRRRDAVLLLDLRGRGRGPARPRAAGRHPRLGAEPDRPGDRVRLLLRARLDGAARRRATRP